MEDLYNSTDLFTYVYIILSDTRDAEFVHTIWTNTWMKPGINLTQRIKDLTVDFFIYIQ